MLSASSPSLRLGFSDSDFISILLRVPPLTRLSCLRVGRNPEDRTRVYHMRPRERGAFSNSIIACLLILSDMCIY